MVNVSRASCRCWLLLWLADVSFWREVAMFIGALLTSPTCQARIQLWMPYELCGPLWFTPDFADYMVDVTFEQETTLTKTSKTELSNSLDGMLGDLSTYWTLWETNAEPDDIVEVYGTRTTPLWSSIVLHGLWKLQLHVVCVPTWLWLWPQHCTRATACERWISKAKAETFGHIATVHQVFTTSNLRPNPEMLEEELADAVVHVDFSMDVLEEQLERDDRGLIWTTWTSWHSNILGSSQGPEVPRAWWSCFGEIRPMPIWLMRPWETQQKINFVCNNVPVRRSTSTSYQWPCSSSTRIPTGFGESDCWWTHTRLGGPTTWQGWGESKNYRID